MTDAPASVGGVPASADTSPETPAADATTPVEDVSALFRKHKHKVKVDEAEEEIDYDELRAGYQKAKAADKRFKAAAALTEKIEKMRPHLDELDLFKKNPWEALKKSGQDPYALAEQLLLEKLEWEGKDPNEQRAIRAEMAARAAEDRLTAAEKADKDRARQSQEAQALQEIDNEIGEAIKATGRKATPRLIARITETLIAHHEKQMSDLQRQYGDAIPDEAYARVQRIPTADAVNRTHSEYVEDVKAYAQGLSIEDLRQVLSREQLDGLRQAEVNKVLAQDPAGSRKPRAAQPGPQARPEKAKRMSTDDFFNKLESKINKRA